MSEEFNTAELIVGGMLALGVDSVCFLLDVFGIGLLIGPALHSGFNFGLWAWLRSKNDPNINKMGRQIGRYLATAIPFLPVNLTIFAVETYIHNHPDRFGAASGLLPSGFKIKP